MGACIESIFFDDTDPKKFKQRLAKSTDDKLGEKKPESMSYKVDSNDKFKKWVCAECVFVNKRFLSCGRYRYGGKDETKCVFCGVDKSKSDDYKDDAVIKFDTEKEKEWQSIIEANLGKFVDSEALQGEDDKTREYKGGYNRTKDYWPNEFTNPAYDTNPPNPSFKAECLNENAGQLTEKDFNLILLKARSIYQNKDIKDKMKATSGAGINVDIKKGDSIGIEHIFAILLYIHFPKFVLRYRVSLRSKFYYFDKFLYEAITYFGQKMPADMVVYAGLSGGIDNEEKKKDDDKDKEEKKQEKTQEEKDKEEKERKKRSANAEFEFFNTAFLISPFSTTRDPAVFEKGTLVIGMKATFLNEFNDTRYLDLSPFSSFTEKDGKNEVVFYGEFSELSFVSMKIQGDDKCDFSDYIIALRYWQKFSTGFADFNDKKYNMAFIPDEKTQKLLLSILNGDKDVPKYVGSLFDNYKDKDGKKGFHRMYSELYDIDFSKICKKVAKGLIKELQEKIFNDDLSDVDSAKIKKLFKDGAKKYVDTLEKEKALS